MSARWRRLGEVLSGGSFFTGWSWLVTLPLAVTVLGGYDAASDATAKAVGLAVATAVHVACGLLGAVGAVLERSTARLWLRRTAVVGTVMTIGLSRPLMIAALTTWVGLPRYPGAMVVRMATNLFATAVALTIVAVVVTTLRRRRQVVLALGAVADALAAERTVGTELRRHAQDLVAAAMRALQPGLRALAHEEPGDAAAALRRFSREAVRPLSHELYESRARIAAEPPPAEPGVRARVTGPFALDAAPAPVATLLYLVLLAPFVLSRMPVGQALATVLSVAACGAATEAFGARLTRRTSAGWQRALAVAVAAVVTAAVIVTVTIGVGALLGVSAGSVRIAGLTYLLVALATARCTALLAALSSEESALAARVGAFRADEAEGRRRAEQLLTDAADALHGDVQGGCLALAAALDAGGAEWPGALQPIRAAIDGLDRPRAAAFDARAAFGRLVGVWARVIDLEVQVDDGVWAELAAQPELAQPFLDAVAESLTNVLRHASAAAAVLTADATASVVMLTVTSPGVPGAATGAGLRELSRRADSVALEEAGGSTRLRVLLGAAS